MQTMIKSNYIKYNHLYIAEDENEVILLGYKLELTKTEYQIIKILIKNGNSPVSAEQISIETGMDLSKENVAFHISSINRKAKFIGNRILIKNISKIGYFLA